MGWGDEEPTEVLEHVDPFPFTALGRQLQRLEHELRVEEARLRVDALQAERREIQMKLTKLRSARQRG